MRIPDCLSPSSPITRLPGKFLTGIPIGFFGQVAEGGPCGPDNQHRPIIQSWKTPPDTKVAINNRILQRHCVCHHEVQVFRYCNGSNSPPFTICFGTHSELPSYLHLHFSAAYASARLDENSLSNTPNKILRLKPSIIGQRQRYHGA